MPVNVLTSLRVHRRERSVGASNVTAVALSSAKNMGISHELKPAPGHIGPPGCNSQEAWKMLENKDDGPQFPKKIKVRATQLYPHSILQPY